MQLLVGAQVCLVFCCYQPTVLPFITIMVLLIPLSILYVFAPSHLHSAFPPFHIEMCVLIFKDFKTLI